MDKQCESCKQKDAKIDQLRQERDNLVTSASTLIDERNRIYGEHKAALAEIERLLEREGHWRDEFYKTINQRDEARQELAITKYRLENADCYRDALYKGLRKSSDTGVLTSKLIKELKDENEQLRKDLDSVKKWAERYHNQLQEYLERET